jgi:luciferase family oxidoreductase group 1
MKNNFNSIPLSILDLAVVLEGNTPTQSFKNSLSLAQKAESLGYLSFWLAEHHNMVSIASSATSILIGHSAGGTTKIRVGSGGIMIHNHTPLVIAEQFGTLVSLYPDRIDLRLGRAPGTEQLTARALQRDDQAPLEFPKTVKQLQNYLSVDNTNAQVRVIPREGLDIPIWILGSSTESAKLAA